MQGPFSHPEFRTYSFENLPLNRDVFLMDEQWLREYEAARIEMFNRRSDRVVGLVSYAAVRAVERDSAELSWYPNVFDRFHEVAVRLPRSAFVDCVDTPGWDEKPRIFVKGIWLSGLHLRPYSAFALVDAIGVKDALSRGQLAGPKLVRLRDRLDAIADANPGLAFVSFADSLLIKMNWFVGQYDSDISYSYEPESLIRIMPLVAESYRAELGMEVYAAIAQGVNEYEDTTLLHRSAAGSHVSLNSLGLPFAQLRAIDDAVRKAIREKAHPPAELYLDQHFYHSLRFVYGFEKDELPRADYWAPLASTAMSYIYTTRETVLKNLDPSPPASRRKRSA
jgi:hypothetical protein